MTSKVILMGVSIDKRIKGEPMISKIGEVSFYFLPDGIHQSRPASFLAGNQIDLVFSVIEFKKSHMAL